MGGAAQLYKKLKIYRSYLKREIQKEEGETQNSQQHYIERKIGFSKKKMILYTTRIIEDIIKIAPIHTHTHTHKMKKNNKEASLIRAAFFFSNLKKKKKRLL